MISQATTPESHFGINPMQTMLTAAEIKLQKQLEEFQDRLSREVSAFSANTQEAIESRYSRCKGSIEEFGRTYAPHYFTAPSAPMHYDLDAMVLGFDPVGERLDGAHIHYVHGPREHAKSVRCRVGLIHRLLFGTVHYPIVISEILTLAQHHLDYILADLTGNRRITSDFDIEVTKRDASEGVIRLRVTPRATQQSHHVQLDAASYGRAVKGRVYMQYRPDFCLIDDFESTRTARNEVISAEKRDWILQEVYPAIAGGPIIWLGNIGHDTSALYLSMRQHHETAEHLKRFLQMGTRPGVMAAAAGLLEADAVGLESPAPEFVPGGGAAADGPGAMPDPDATAPDPLFELDEDELDNAAPQIEADVSVYCYRADRLVVTEAGELTTEHLWGQRFSPRWYERRRRTMGPFLYDGEMNGFPSREGDFFKREWFAGNEWVWDDLKEVDADLRWFSWFDPAFGKSGKGAYKAICVCAFDGKQFYVVDAYVRNTEPVASAIQAWYRLFDQYTSWGLRHGQYENDFAQDDRLQLDLANEAARRGFPLNVSGDSNRRGSKEARIESLQPTASNYQLRFPLRMNADVERLYNQLLAYPGGADDGPDALESCIARLRRGAAMDLEYSSVGPGRRYERTRRSRRSRRR